MVGSKLPPVDLTLSDRALLAAMVRREARKLGYPERYHIQNRAQWPARLKRLEIVMKKLRRDG